MRQGAQAVITTDTLLIFPGDTQNEIFGYIRQCAKINRLFACNFYSHIITIC